MKRASMVMICVLMVSAAAVHADEVVFKGPLGLIAYVKKNIRLQDTVVVGATSYLRYTGLDGTTQLPLNDVIEIRFIPYDLTEVAAMTVVPDTLAIPVVKPPSGTPPKVVVVSSVAALKTTLLDNTVDEIVMTNGRYAVSRASSQASNSLWIGTSYASRTRPVLVRAQTRGGVTFDGGGTTVFGGLTFMGGVHHQTWDGFNFTNGDATSTGVVTIGGYTGSAADAAPVHHITMRYINVFGCSGVSKSSSSPATDHAVYISWSTGGPYQLVFDYWSIDDRSHLGLSSAFHFYHSDVSQNLLNAHDCVISNLTVRGTQQAFLLWDPTLKNITVTDAVIKGALTYAVRYESPGATGMVLKNVVSTASGSRGFYSSAGTNPSGLSFINCVWN